MTWRIPPFDRALAELEAHVRATYAPLGVVVSGSIVRGEGRPPSDLDVFVVHEAPWRLREQRLFAGVPTELFVNPPARIRRYFETEHAAGRPSTAHMFATGEVLAPHPVIDELSREARAWLARPPEIGAAQLMALRCGAVDLLDDARDVVAEDPAAAALLAAQAVGLTVSYAFRSRGRFEPRRKVAVAALAALDPAAAALVRRWAEDGGVDAAAVLLRHVLGVDGFFEWISDRDPVAVDG